MAFRIHDSVVRGEIDNRVKGVVRGRIWVEGRAGSVVLELKGNAWPDLAGCLLTFTNPQQRIPHPGLDSLDLIQRGSTLKVKLPRGWSSARIWSGTAAVAVTPQRRRKPPAVQGYPELPKRGSPFNASDPQMICFIGRRTH